MELLERLIALEEEELFKVMQLPGFRAEVENSTKRSIDFLFNESTILDSFGIYLSHLLVLFFLNFS